MTKGKKYYIKNPRTGKKLERTFTYNDLQVVDSSNWRLNKEKLELGDDEEFREENKKDALKKLKAQRKVWQDLGDEDRDKAFEALKDMAKERPKRKAAIKGQEKRRQSQKKKKAKPKKKTKPKKKASPKIGNAAYAQRAKKRKQKKIEEDDEKIGEEEPQPKRRSKRKGKGEIDRFKPK